MGFHGILLENISSFTTQKDTEIGEKLCTKLCSKLYKIPFIVRPRTETIPGDLLNSNE